MENRTAIAWWVLLVVGFAGLVLGANTKPHEFAKGDVVPLYVNKVGPYRNPTETYPFYRLPFCKPEKLEGKPMKLGENLEGDDMKSSLYEIPFRTNFESKSLCPTRTLSEAEVQKFLDAIQNRYWFQMVFDDLPVYGFVGKSVFFRVFLYTHLHFRIEYNEKNVIQVNASADSRRLTELHAGRPESVQFSYSAEWFETETKFENRAERHMGMDFFREDFMVHWRSITNAFVLVLLLLFFLVLILRRTLGQDFRRYATSEDVESLEPESDFGWKLVHADVFRIPRRKSLLCAILGVSAQLTAMWFSLLLLAVGGVFYPGNRGKILVAGIVLHAGTSCIGGGISAAAYKLFDGANWVRNVVLSCALLVVPVGIVVFITNGIAVFYGSTVALPFTALAFAFSLFAFVGLPLFVLGGIAGKNVVHRFQPPVRVGVIPREIVYVPWYHRTIPHMTVSGALPFSAIYVELYYVFTSVWGHHTYTFYSLLMLAFAMVIVVTAFLSVALTYFQLSCEDHRWWWRSILNGGSPAFFVFLFATQYYLSSSMSGLFQASFFFLYTGAACYCIFLLLGGVGFLASMLFVRAIYSGLKHVD